MVHPAAPGFLARTISAASPCPTPARPSAQPASPPQPSRPVLKFGPLSVLAEALSDPRWLPPALVGSAVVRLVEAEGPMTESWLIRRYAQLAGLNSRQVSATLSEAMALTEGTGR